MLLASDFSHLLSHRSEREFPADELLHLDAGWGQSPLSAVGQGLSLIMNIVHSSHSSVCGGLISNEVLCCYGNTNEKPILW